MAWHVWWPLAVAPKLQIFWLGIVESPSTVFCGGCQCMAVRLVRQLLCTVFVPLVANAVVNVLLGNSVHRVRQVAQDPQCRFWVEL